MIPSSSLFYLPQVVFSKRVYNKCIRTLDIYKFLGNIIMVAHGNWFLVFISSPGQRPCELMAWCGVCPSVRSSVNTYFSTSSLKLLTRFWWNLHKSIYGPVQFKFVQIIDLAWKRRSLWPRHAKKLQKSSSHEGINARNLKPTHLSSVILGLSSLYKWLTLTLIQGHSEGTCKICILK